MIVFQKGILIFNTMTTKDSHHRVIQLDGEGHHWEQRECGDISGPGPDHTVPAGDRVIGEKVVVR